MQYTLKTGIKKNARKIAVLSLLAAFTVLTPAVTLLSASSARANASATASWGTGSVVWQPDATYGNTYRGTVNDTKTDGLCVFTTVKLNGSWTTSGFSGSSQSCGATATFFHNDYSPVVTGFRIQTNNNYITLCSTSDECRH